MNGIYIPGMEMPKNETEELCIVIRHDGTVHYPLDLNCNKIANAIPVPDHGRLIDADALKVSLAFAEKTGEWVVPVLRAVMIIIDEMPTIIPTDKDGANG